MISIMSKFLYYLLLVIVSPFILIWGLGKMIDEIIIQDN